MALSAKNRAEIVAPVVSQEAQASQYSELTEDELIELASELGERVTLADTAVQGRRDALELAAVVEALKLRRDIASPARYRIGEYLRQQAILEAKFEKDSTSSSDYSRRNARPVEDVRDTIRSDLYAKAATLKLSDLRMLTTPVVRDTKALFEAEQQRRLELWKAKGLSEKQAALLECIAKGHMTKYMSMGESSYSGDSKSMWDGDRCQVCKRPDGRTMGALERKGVFGFLASLGEHRVGGGHRQLMLKDPEKTSK